MFNFNLQGFAAENATKAIRRSLSPDFLGARPVLSQEYTPLTASDVVGGAIFDHGGI